MSIVLSDAAERELRRLAGSCFLLDPENMDKTIGKRIEEILDAGAQRIDGEPSDAARTESEPVAWMNDFGEVLSKDAHAALKHIGQLEAVGRGHPFDIPLSRHHKKERKL